MQYGRVVLGIGNPGPDYEDTRHNAGFMVLDRLAARAGVTFKRLERKDPDGRKLFGGRVKAQVALLGGATPAGVAQTPDAAPALLVKPLTYVNLSGDVAGPLLRAADLAPESLFVVVDDLNLPLGRIRVRPAGSSGGHNGLESIEQALGTSGYPRLRLGIGKPAGIDPYLSVGSGSETAVDFVLARFLPEERQVLDLVLERCADICAEWLRGESLESLMGRHNAFLVSIAEPCDGGGDPGEM
ncbi:MAG: aminoacyl-tRNA hydrolase [Planctomycetes bacterium]|nr:aminoacyl-tRNA hydrolase [Planctomycetota bacterium]